MAPRLKVFVMSDGLTDYAVAASSKPKALAAWGSHQDLFRTGLAHETQDAELSAAALAQPGEVLKRPAGSRAILSKHRPARASEPRSPSQAALRRIATLEKRLESTERSHAGALAAIEARQAALDRERERLVAGNRTRREKLEAALKAARQAPR